MTFTWSQGICREKYKRSEAMETQQLRLRKFDLSKEPNATMNVETYFNGNWDKIDESVRELNETVNSNKCELDRKIQEQGNELGQEIVNKATELQNALSSKSTELDTKIQEETDKINQKLEGANVLPFEMCNQMKSLPSGAKGILSPRIEGMPMMVNETSSLLNTDVKKSYTATAIHDGVKLDLDLEGKKGHIYYGSCEIKSNYDKLYLLLNDSIQQKVEKAKSDGAWHRLSCHIRISDNATCLYTKIQDSNESNWREFDYQSWLVVDLTMMFGSGNEPSKEWCDDNLHYIKDLQMPTKSYRIQSRSKNVFDYNLLQFDDRIKRGKNNELILDKVWAYVTISGHEVSKLLKPNTRYTSQARATILSSSGLTQYDNSVGFSLHNPKIKRSIYMMRARCGVKVGDQVTITGAFTTPDNLKDWNMLAYSQLFAEGDKVDKSVVKIEDISIQEEGKTEKKVDFETSETFFTVPEEHPLTQLPNGTKNYINEKKEYVVKVKKFVLNSETVRPHLVNEKSDETSSLFLINNLGLNKNYNEATPCAFLQGLIYRYTYTDTQKEGYFVGYQGHLYIRLNNEKASTVEAFKSWLDVEEPIFLGELEKGIVLKDGQEGFKAPGDLYAFGEGDFLVNSMRKRTFNGAEDWNYLDTVNKGKRVYLSADKFGDYLDYEKNFSRRNFQCLDYKSHQIVNGDTSITPYSIGWYKSEDRGFIIHLPDANTKWNESVVTRDQIKEYLKKHPISLEYVVADNQHIYPKVKANLPANLGTALDQNTKAISKSNQKILSLEEKLDLLIVLNS